MILNAFTCTGSYAILILYGIKRTENRSAWPEPREGRAAISCSKSFCKEEYGQFIAWASVNLPPEDFEKLPAWPEPIPCRGNVGMWALPPSIAQSVLEQVHSLQTVKSVEANAAAVRIETPDDAYPLFRAAVPLVGAREGFFILPIDTQRRPICKPVLVSLGHLPGTAAIELGEVFRTAFKVNADAIIVAHNHPSGDPTPSKADMQLTSVLQSTARLLGVKFLDHLVLGSADYEDGRGFVSLVEWQEHQ